MFNKKLLIKRLSKLLLSINERIESFFNYLKNFKALKKKIEKNYKIIGKKIFIIAGPLVIILLCYFLIPLSYDKTLLQTKLTDRILEKYNLEVKLEKPIKYHLFPKPHFQVEDVTLVYKENNIGNSENINIYLSFKNFFSLEDLKIKNLHFKKTNFSIKYHNISFFKNLLRSNKSDRSIIFFKSKIFYKDQNDEIIFFSNINKLVFSYNEKFNQELNAILEIFNIPLKLNIIDNLKDKKIFTKIKSFKLRLNVENNFNYGNKNSNGLLNIKIINEFENVDYNLNGNSLSFNSNKLNISGNIDFIPFYLTSLIELDQIDIKKILENNSILLNLLNSDILHNQNLSAKININSKSIKGINFLNDIKLSIHFEEGNIIIKDSSLNWKNSIDINMENIQLINNSDKISVVGTISVNFTNLDNFYKQYQVKKAHRKKIKKVKLDFLLDLNEKKVEINNVKVDGSSIKNVNNFLNEFNNKEKDIFNKVIFKNSIKEFFGKI